MKTMIWKELRENFKWALLALVGLTMAELYALSSVREARWYDSNFLTLCGSTFLMVTSYGCAAIGAALGVAQILPELRRDQWAALLHRPVSRSVIFFGKVGAGLLLYFFAVTLPFLISVFYAATPGRFAVPLVPGMLIPGGSDLFLGAVFYFASLLLCLHRGRWLGSRGLIGLSVVPVFLIHSSMGWPFLFPLLASLLLLLAAWATMLSREGTGNQPRAGRVALLLVVLLGAETAWLIVLFGLRLLPAAHDSSSGYHAFEVTQEGKVFLMTQKDAGSAPVLTDLDGKVVTDERYIGNNANQGFLPLYPLCFDFEWERKLLGAYLSGAPRSPTQYIDSVRLDYDSRENWYQLIGENYFIGYDKLSRRCIGIFDREGFKPAGAAPKPFPVPLAASQFSYGKPFIYWSGPQLYAFDFSERSMIPFFNAEGDAIHGASSEVKSVNRDQLAPVAVALEKEIRIFDPQGHPLIVIPYGYDKSRWDALGLAMNAVGDRFYVQYGGGLWRHLIHPKEEGKPTVLDEIDAKGTVLHSYTLPSPAPVAWSPEWRGQLSTFSSPLLPALLGTIHQRLFPVKVPIIGLETNSYPRPAFNVEVGDAAILAVIASLLGGIALAWARRAGFSGRRAGGWALFVFCFGLPGLIAFRLAAKWPVRVACPQCGVPRPIETEGCPACQRPWPLPSANGTEIFDGGKTAVEAGLG